MSTNIKARRKLSDLYRKGVEVRFGTSEPRVGDPDVAGGLLVDEDERPIRLGADEVQMWVQPPSPLQREMAMREAQAARARSLVKAKRDENSEEYLTIMAFLVDMSDETLIDYVVLGNHEDRHAEAVRDVLGRDEWENLETYQDAMRQFDEMPPEELEAKRDEYDAMLELDAKFGEEVRVRELELAEADRNAFGFRSRETNEKAALDRRSEIVGQQAFMYEYEQQMQFYACRDFDTHGQLFFTSARELAEQDEEVLQAVRTGVSMFISDTGEAKNSRRAASGSEQSEPPSEPETSAPSTPSMSNG